MKKVYLSLCALLAFVCASCLGGGDSNNSVSFAVVQLNYNYDTTVDGNGAYLTLGEYTYALDYDNNSATLTLKTIVEKGGSTLTNFSLSPMTMKITEKGYTFMGGYGSSGSYSITDMNGKISGDNLISVNYNINNTLKVKSCPATMAFPYGNITPTEGEAWSSNVRMFVTPSIVAEKDTHAATVYIYGLRWPGVEATDYPATSFNDAALTADAKGIHITMPAGVEELQIYGYNSIAQVAPEYKVNLGPEQTVSKVNINIDPETWTVTGSYYIKDIPVEVNMRMFE